jgi:hypothetical protein
VPTSDEINTFISQISPFFGRIPGVGALIDQLAQLMLGQGPLSPNGNGGVFVKSAETQVDGVELINSILQQIREQTAVSWCKKLELASSKMIKTE